MRILLKTKSGWKPVDSHEYGLEVRLEDLLLKSPEVIPIDADAPAGTRVVYARQFGVGGHSLDLVGIGSDGTISVVECKLATNPEAKREVVGQILEYGADLWSLPVEEFLERFRRSLQGKDPFEILRDNHQEGWIEEDCRAEIARRLREGDFRLIIAVDGVSEGLRNIIKYVNSKGGNSGGLRLVALSIPYFVSKDGVEQVELLVPELFGDEAVPQPRRRESGRTVEELLLIRPDPAEREAARRLHDMLTTVFSTRTATASISYDARDPSGSLRSVLSLYFKDQELRLYLPGWGKDPAVSIIGVDAVGFGAALEEVGFKPIGTSIKIPPTLIPRLDDLIDVLRRHVIDVVAKQ